MARYYFQLSDGKEVLKTGKGLELLGNAAAREEDSQQRAGGTGPNNRGGGELHGAHSERLAASASTNSQTSVKVL